MSLSETPPATSFEGETPNDALEAEGRRLLAELGLPATPEQPPDDERTPLDDPEHFTARRLLEYRYGLEGTTLAERALPPTLLATFQPAAYSQLVAATHAEDAHAWYWREDTALARGRAGERPVAITRLRIGAPAAVAQLEELMALGARTILALGVAGSLQPDLPVGALALPTGAIREEGTSFHYVPAGQPVAPDPALAEALHAAARAEGVALPAGTVWSTDAVYRETQSKILAYGAAGVLAVEMEAAALFAAAAFRGARLALLVAISDELFHPWNPGFHTEELRAALALGARILVRAAQGDTET